MYNLLYMGRRQILAIVGVIVVSLVFIIAILSVALRSVKTPTPSNKLPDLKIGDPIMGYDVYMNKDVADPSTPWRIQGTKLDTFTKQCNLNKDCAGFMSDNSGFGYGRRNTEIPTVSYPGRIYYYKIDPNIMGKVYN